MEQKNIQFDNKLRELESKQLPDLSYIESHWKMMQMNLPAANPFLSLIKGKLWLLVGTLVVTSSAILISFLNKAPNKVKAMPALSFQDTIPLREEVQRDTALTYDHRMAIRTKVHQPYRHDSMVAGKRRRALPQRTTSAAPPKTKYNTDTVLPVPPTRKIIMIRDTATAIPRRKKSPQKVMLKARTSDGKDTILEASIIESESIERIPVLELVKSTSEIKHAVATIKVSESDPKNFSVNVTYKTLPVPTVHLQTVKATRIVKPVIVNLTDTLIKR